MSGEVREAAREAIAWHRDREKANHSERLFAELCRRCGFARVVMRVEAGDVQATVVHECAHALVRLLAPGAAFQFVEYRDDGSGRVLVAPDGVAWTGREPSVTERLVYLVAGAAAEDLLFARVVAGAHDDLTRALALARMMPGQEPDHAEGLVRDAVAVARELLTRESVALLALVEELRARRRLTRAECVEVLHRRGIEVPEPRYGTVQTDIDEADRMAVLEDCAKSVAHRHPSLFEQLIAAGDDPEARRAAKGAWEAERAQ
jgi:hypothetical protein